MSKRVLLIILSIILLVTASILIYILSGRFSLFSTKIVYKSEIAQTKLVANNQEDLNKFLKDIYFWESDLMVKEFSKTSQAGEMIKPKSLTVVVKEGDGVSDFRIVSANDRRNIRSLDWEVTVKGKVTLYIYINSNLINELKYNRDSIITRGFIRGLNFIKHNTSVTNQVMEEIRNREEEYRDRDLINLEVSKLSWTVGILYRTVKPVLAACSGPDVECGPLAEWEACANNHNLPCPRGDVDCPGSYCKTWSDCGVLSSRVACSGLNQFTCSDPCSTIGPLWCTPENFCSWGGCSTYEENLGCNYPGCGCSDQYCWYHEYSNCTIDYTCEGSCGGGGSPPACTVTSNAVCNADGTQITVDWNVTSSNFNIAEIQGRFNPTPYSNWPNESGDLSLNWGTGNSGTVTTNISGNTDYSISVGVYNDISKLPNNYICKSTSQILNCPTAICTVSSNASCNTQGTQITTTWSVTNTNFNINAIQGRFNAEPYSDWINDPHSADDISQNWGTGTSGTNTTNITSGVNYSTSVGVYKDPIDSFWNNYICKSTSTILNCAAPNGTVQGIRGIVSTSVGTDGDYFEKVNNNVIYSAVRLRDASGVYAPPDPNTTDPYSFSNLILQSGRTRTLSVANVNNYERGWTRCYNGIGCDHVTPASITPGASLSISESSMIGSPPVPNPLADVWFHFTPLPRCTISGDSTIPLNGIGSWNVTSNVDIVNPVTVKNQVGVFKTTPNVSNPTVPKKTIGDGALLGTTKDCGNVTPCTQTVTFDTSGLTVGTRFYVYCRAANGILTYPLGSPLSPPDLLHECNPFCISGGGNSCASGETDATYRTHPFDYNCGASDYMMIEIAPPAWWQTQHGNVTSKSGRIVSKIPATANYRFLINNDNILYPDYYPFPGVLEYGSSTATPIYLGSGTVNANPLKQWKAGFESSVSLPPIEYFEKKFPNDVRTVMEDPAKNKLTNSVLDQATLNKIGAGSSPYENKRGYYSFLYDGTNDLNIGDPLVTGDQMKLTDGIKVIIYVPHANVNINTQIHFNKGKAFFMLIAKGNISVDATDVGGVGIPDYVTPDLEGVFYTESLFSSGSSNRQLHVRGIVTADSFAFSRSLGAADDFYPGELFEYDPAQTLMFPAFLSLKTYARQEVAP